MANPQDPLPEKQVGRIFESFFLSSFLLLFFFVCFSCILSVCLSVSLSLSVRVSLSLSFSSCRHSPTRPLSIPLPPAPKAHPPAFRGVNSSTVRSTYQPWLHEIATRQSPRTLHKHHPSPSNRVYNRVYTGRCRVSACLKRPGPRRNPNHPPAACPAPNRFWKTATVIVPVPPIPTSSGRRVRLCRSPATQPLSPQFIRKCGGPYVAP